MGYPILILGESGTGKSASLRNLDPQKTLLMQTIRKPLPFRSVGWSPIDRNGSGNVAVTDNWQRIINGIASAQNFGKEVVIIDDFQYLLANEFMRRSNEKSYDKFTEIGYHAWSVMMAAQEQGGNCRVYFLSHTQIDDTGHTKAKTIGKLLDEKITVEGLFSVVLRTAVTDQGYFFSTKNNGADTVKSPIGLFDSSRIDNDLAAVDQQIKNYYEIG